MITKIIKRRGINMVTLFGIILFGLIVGIIALIIGAVALPIVIVFLVLGVIFSIIALAFKLIFGPIALIVIVIIGAMFFSKNRIRK